MKRIRIVSYNVGHGFYNDQTILKKNQRNINIHYLFQLNRTKYINNIEGQIKLLKNISADYIILQESSNLFFPYFYNQQKVFSKKLEYLSKYYSNLKILNTSIGNQILYKNINDIVENIKIPIEKKINNNNFIVLNNEKQKLVIINIHLIAFKENEILRQQQIEYIYKYALKKYNDGYQVIIGGDWNYNFSNKNKYISNFIDKIITQGWNFAVPNESTRRDLYMPFVTSKKYKLDYFLCSPNVIIKSINSLSNYKYSDHSPVVLEILIIK